MNRPLVFAIAAAFVTACGGGLQPLPTSIPTPVRVPEGEPELPLPTAERRTTQPAEIEYLESRRLLVPVEGADPARIPDSYTAPRSGGRTHFAVDIFAPRGTPVVSADDGTILRVTTNALGGKTIYATDPERRLVFYYAHLDDWAKGISEGQDVSRGSVIGYVGTTGNAPKNTPHLHFQVMRMSDGRRWWEGEPMNPLPYLTTTGRQE